MAENGEMTCRELVTLVTDYLEGRLPPQDRVRFDEHIGGCPHCTAYLAQMRQAVRLTGMLAEEALPREALEALLAALSDWR